MFADKLMTALRSSRRDHPERSPATCERVIEVLESVLKKRSESLISQCWRTVGTPRSYLTGSQAKEITARIIDQCSESQVRLIMALLMESEVSTQEAIDLHEEYKIPVSHLEKDIVPVRGEGAWITDTRGRANLDMDSNYSATNLGMNNPEVAIGLFNQAMLLISMKEDRVHIPRARFLKNIHPMMPKGLTQFYWQNSGGGGGRQGAEDRQGVYAPQRRHCLRRWISRPHAWSRSRHVQ